MKKFIIHKMQALPASFFTAICGFTLFTMMVSVQTGFSLMTYADYSMSLSDNIARVNLVKQAVRLPQSLQSMDEGKISILLREPSLKRKEFDVTAWHYHGNSCSLAIYFSQDAENPNYIEYRTLSMNADISAQFEQNDQNTINQYCIKDVLEAQGVNTPDNFARQPTPTWDNPYRT